MITEAVRPCVNVSRNKPESRRRRGFKGPENYVIAAVPDTPQDNKKNIIPNVSRKVLRVMAHPRGGNRSTRRPYGERQPNV